MKQILIFLFLLPVIAFGQAEPQIKNFNVTRYDQVTLPFTLGRALTGAGDSVRFTIKVSYLSTYSIVSNGTWRAFGGSASQIQIIDSTNGIVQVKLTAAQTYNLVEASYVYDVKVGTVLKWRGVINMLASTLQPAASAFVNTATLSDTLDANVSRSGGTGVTTTVLRDSLNALFTTGSRKLKQLTDTLNANIPRNALSLSTLTDSLNTLPRFSAGTAQGWIRDTANGLNRTPNATIQGWVKDSLNAITRARALPIADSNAIALGYMTKTAMRVGISDTANTLPRFSAGTVQGWIKDTANTLPRFSSGTAQGWIKDSTTALVTAGGRGISSTARMFVADDSITFLGEAGDVIDCALGNSFRGTIGASDTLSFSNMADGQIVTVVITNANNYTLVWTGVAWSGGTAPTLTATANKRDVFTFYRAGGIVYGSYVQNF
jgi:hypothetical protein